MSIPKGKCGLVGGWLWMRIAFIAFDTSELSPSSLIELA
jgi:hypothetical protein